MKFSVKMCLSAALTALTATSVALACGTPPPQNPPPPPPDPPIVCCSVIARVPCPIDPCNFEYWIVCYGRIDGLPLFVSNPMPLPPNQTCLCGLPPMPQAAAAAGASVVGVWFTNPGNIPWDPTQIPDEPGYGPFNPITDPNLQLQVDSFFDIYYTAAGLMPPPGTDGLSSIFGFSGNPDGTGQIFPGLAFNIYKCLRVPRGFDPNLLCPPLQEAALGLFLADNGQVGLEPGQGGNPPIPLPLYVPGDGAMYKIRWYPMMVPPSCPPPLPGDLNGDLVVNTADLGILLGNFGSIHPCP
ncbi:MAG: hypothetical protein H6814_11395 [Phycisphaeraceae bacterium]|nr:hypothetical protein [Phycisphaeraceae bacterium]